MKRGIALVLWCWASYVWGASAASVFQKKLQSIRTMQASFDQVTYASTHERSRASGTMALARPGRFRWQTEKPIAQRIIADGKHVWVYDVDLEQVTVRKQTQQMSPSANLFLSNDGVDWSASFNISVHTAGNRHEFDLISTSSHADFKRVVFQFEGDVLRGMEFLDSLGQRTTIHFHHVKTNQAVPGKLFHFTPPKGVDLVDEGDAGD